MAHDDQCKDCKFRHSETSDIVECRRYPPGVNGWPYTHDHNWCGEFKKGAEHDEIP